MAYKKKLTDTEFLKLIIDKELEIAGADFRFDDIIAMPDEERRAFKWFQIYGFNTYQEYMEWKNFFFEKFYDWQPKYITKKQAEREFSWINLQYGLTWKYPYELNYLMDNPVFAKCLDYFKTIFPNYDENTGNVEFNYDVIFRLEEYQTLLNKLKKNFDSFINTYDEGIKEILASCKTKEPAMLVPIYKHVFNDKKDIKQFVEPTVKVNNETNN